MLRTVAELFWHLWPGSLVHSWVAGTERERALPGCYGLGEGESIGHIVANPASRMSRIERPELLIAPSPLKGENVWGKVGWGEHLHI